MTGKNKNKLIILLIVLLSPFFLIYTRKEKNVRLIWLCPYSPLDEDGIKYFNNLLKEKGYRYEIQFSVFQNQNEYYAGGEIPDIIQADIVTLLNDSVYTGAYKEYVREGKLEDLSDFLKNSDGKELYTSFPENVWKGVMINQKIYAINIPYFAQYAYLIVDKKMLNEYGFGLNDIKETSVLDIAKTISLKEVDKGNNKYQCWTGMCLDRYKNVQCPIGSSGIGVFYENGRWHADFLVNMKEWVSLIKEITEIESITRNNDTSNNSNSYLFSIVYSYSEDAAVMSVLSEKENTSDYEAIDISCYFDNSYRGLGVKTGVSAQSKYKQEAMDLLKAVFTDRELSECLAYGMEGKDYIIVNNRISPYEGSSNRFYGNPFIIRSIVDEPDDKGMLLQEVFRDPVSELCGFYFNTSSFQPEWNKLVNVFLEHYTFYCGQSNNPDLEIKVIQEELKEIDTTCILDEMEHQLYEFEANKSK